MGNKVANQNKDRSQHQSGKVFEQFDTPIDQSAIDQSANGNDAQTTLANIGSITEHFASTIGIREWTESFIAQFVQDSTPDPEVIAQVFSPCQL